MTIVLRPYQATAIDRLRVAYAAGRRAPLLVAPTGSGKCLGLGTPVLRFDGSIVAVENVAEGELLMGPDSAPRRVLSTARGTGELYRVIPIKGESWVCNDVHVLTLVHIETGAIIDVDLPTYLSETKNFRSMHKQFSPKQGIDFEPSEPLPLDPYFLGVWYGDGTKALNGVAISKPDPEIEACVRDIAAQFGLRVRVDGVTCPSYHLIHERSNRPNQLLDLLRAITGDGIALPHRYLVASRTDRLAFLAGLLDTDGYMHRSGFDIVQKQRGFSAGICFLARSLGLRAIMSPKDVNGTRYWRVSISGDCSVIPTRIPRKRAPERRQIKCATRTGITVLPIGVGDYAGFEIDGDGRFLLGDFTVTHNTIIASHVVQSAHARGNRSLFVAPRRELIGQTVRKLAEAGVWDVRVIRAAEDSGRPDAPVIVGSIQTLTMPRWLDRLPQADLVIADEAHHMAADQWSKLAGKYPTARWLGLSATPERADGRPLGDIFDAIVVAASVRELTDLGNLVPCRVFAPARQLDAAQLALDPVVAYQQHGAGALGVAFCVTVEHAERTRDAFAAAGIPSAVITGKTPGAQRDDIIARWAAGDIRMVANCGVLTEGFDLPALSVAILARRFGHAGLFLQCVGRVLRPSPSKTLATVVDLCGSVHVHGTPDMDREYSLTGKAISGVKRDAIRQCLRCGAVFPAADADACPACGLELPRREQALPRSTGVGVVDIATLPKTPTRSFVVSITAKYPGVCRICNERIDQGEQIYWAKGEKPRHVECRREVAA